MKLFAGLLLVLACVHLSCANVSCIDVNGKSVDWWFMLKLPDVVGLYKGYTYLYVDPNHSEYIRGDLHNDTNPLALTIYQIGLYGHTVDKDSVAYVLWNDQTYDKIGGKTVDHEIDRDGVYYAHSKATIAFDASSGFWLAHSAPGFPYKHDISPTSWIFPEGQSIYAQHFFCVTVPTSEIEKISQFLLNYHAFIYDFNIPAKMTNMDNFNSFVNEKFTTSNSTMSFNSVEGLHITAFGKHGLTHSDIYEDYIAPGLSSGSLFVECWCGGTYGDDCQPSFCKGAPISDPSTPQKSESTYPYSSITIEKFSFASNLYYETKNNHAKFALSEKNSFVCPSDNNRAYTQRSRGGGSLCFQHEALYSLLYSHITGFNTTCS